MLMTSSKGMNGVGRVRGPSSLPFASLGTAAFSARSPFEEQCRTAEAVPSLAQHLHAFATLEPRNLATFQWRIPMWQALLFTAPHVALCFVLLCSLLVPVCTSVVFLANLDSRGSYPRTCSLLHSHAMPSCQTCSGLMLSADWIHGYLSVAMG